MEEQENSDMLFLTKPRLEVTMLLNKRIRSGRELLNRAINNDYSFGLVFKDYDRWRKYNLLLLENLFTTSIYIKEYKKKDGVYLVLEELGFDKKVMYYRTQLDYEIHTLESIVDRLELISEITNDSNSPIENVKKINQSTSIKHQTNKVFISHSSKDKAFVEEVIEFLETIGLKSDQIFCSSFEGYGINLGENFLERIKNELDDNVLVLFILTENFYNSPTCLCEMGATWIKTSTHIPVLIPPFDFDNVKGVIPLTQGFKLNDTPKLNLLKEQIEKSFEITPIDFSSWERKRDKILRRINRLIGKD